MARIIYGAIITDINGSIGGITFQKNGSGQIARLKPRKTKTNTQKQRDQQPRLKEVQREWNELSLANKILWNDFASVNNKIGLDGQEKKLTGYQWFLTINQNRLLFNDSILVVPPTFEIVNPIDGISVVFESDELFAELSNEISTEDYNIAGYASFILNSASKFDFTKCRFISTLLLDDVFFQFNSQVEGNDFWAQYFNSVFPPNLGNKDFYMTFYLRAISKTSGISSLAYTAIEKFIWDGLKYVIE